MRPNRVTVHVLEHFKDSPAIKTPAAGTTIFKAGDPADFVYILIDGQANLPGRQKDFRGDGAPRPARRSRPHRWQAAQRDRRHDPHARRALELLVDHVERGRSLPPSQCVARGGSIADAPAQPGHCASLFVP
jgi:hypothetical protein